MNEDIVDEDATLEEEEFSQEMEVDPSENPSQNLTESITQSTQRTPEDISTELIKKALQEEPVIDLNVNGWL